MSIFLFGELVEYNVIPISRTHSVTVIGVGSLIFKGDNHLGVAGSILTAG